jgi:hypothetical protein
MLPDELRTNTACSSEGVQSSQEEKCFDLETSRRSHGQGFKIFLGVYVFLAQISLFSWVGEVIVACLCGPCILGFGIAYFPSFFRKIRVVVAPESRVVLLESVSLRSGKLITVKDFPIDKIASVDYLDRTHGDGLEKVTIDKCRISFRFNDGHRATIADTEDVSLALSFSRECHAAIIRAKGG